MAKQSDDELRILEPHCNNSFPSTATTTATAAAAAAITNTNGVIIIIIIIIITFNIGILSVYSTTQLSPSHRPLPPITFPRFDTRAILGI